MDEKIKDNKKKRNGKAAMMNIRHRKNTVIKTKRCEPQTFIHLFSFLFNYFHII